MEIGLGIKKIIYVVALFLTIFSSTVSVAQTDRVLVELADEMYGFGDFEGALGIYLQALEENATNVRANYMSGVCYSYTIANKADAVPYFLKAYELDPEVNADILYKIAEGYRFGYKLDDAISYYNKYINDIDTDRRKFSDRDPEELKKRANRRIENCQNAKEFVNNPVSVVVKSLGPTVNSEADDYAPTLSRDDKIMIFTSRREGGMSILKDVDNKFFEDIYVTTFEDGDWTAPINLGDKVNSEQHDSNFGISPDGERLYIYKTDNNGDVYVSEKKKGVWQSPVALKKPINTEYRESSLFESADGKRMFFASDRPGGSGGMDLYIGYRDEKGKVKTVERLSDVVNTEYDEDGPFFDEKTNTLYFSSKGHNSMGNFDLFYSIYDPENDSWGEPHNLGYPICSSDDDLFFSLSSDGETAYYSSYKEDSQGGLDLYKIFPFTEAEFGDKDPEPVAEVEPELIDSIVEEPIVLQPVNFELKAYDQATDEPVTVNVKVVRLDDDSEYENTDGIEGMYSTQFSPGQAGEYIVTLESPGYLYQTVKVSVQPSGDEQLLISKSIAMRRPKVKQVNILRNIYFSFDNYTLTNASHNELDVLTEMLTSNPAMRIEVAGHTDFIGTDEYNYELSLKRATAVQKFLVNNGANPNQIELKGYGKKKPLASNDDETEGRALNRRTEFIILQQ